MNTRHLLIVIIVLLGIIAWLLWERRSELAIADFSPTTEAPRTDDRDPTRNTGNSSNSPSIDERTKEAVVVAYVKAHGQLPDYYITKAEARKKGWIASKGNLCEVLPGRAIGGDRFGNREKLLPEKSGRQWFEGDLNYDCGRRNADRILFSSDGLIYVTHDHYKTVIKR